MPAHLADREDDWLGKAAADASAIVLDERLRFERSEAIRLGYMVVIVLGAIAAICSNYWSAFVARCWPLIIILGVLVPQVRLIVLDHRVVLEARDDTQ